MNARRGWWLWLALLLPLPGRPAESLGVLAVSDPPGPAGELVGLAEQLRGALEPLTAGVLESAALRERMIGRPPPPSPQAMEQAYAAALASHDKGDFEGSIRALRALVQDLERVPGSGNHMHEQWIRAMVRLARSEQAVGRRGEAQAVLERLLRIEPEVEVDAALYPPGFLRLVDEVRSQIRSLWTRKLKVESQAGAHVFVEGRDAGEVPVTLQLPPGRYRISGELSGIRAHEVVVDLGEDRTIQLDLSVVEVLRPEAPGLALPAADRVGRILTTASWLRLDRVVAATFARQDGANYLGAALYDVRRGITERGGRVKLDGKTPPPGALEALAAYLMSGTASPLVEAGPAFALGLPEEGVPGIGTWGRPRPNASKIPGWTAVGTAVATLALGTVAVVEALQAKRHYDNARGMLDSTNQPAFPNTTVTYNNEVAIGNKARDVALATGIGAGVTLVATGVLGYLSYKQTGEIGPFRF